MTSKEPEYRLMRFQGVEVQQYIYFVHTKSMTILVCLINLILFLSCGVHLMGRR